MKYLKYLKESNKINFETQITDAFIDFIDDDIAFIDEVSDDFCSILIKISKIYYDWEESLENNKNGYDITRKINNILSNINYKYSIKMCTNPKLTINNIDNKKLSNYNFLEIKFIESKDSKNKLILSNKGDTVYINSDFLVDKFKSFGLELIIDEELSYYSNTIGFCINKDKELTIKQQMDISSLFIDHKIEINFSESIYGLIKYIKLSLLSKPIAAQRTGRRIYPILV